MSITIVLSLLGVAYLGLGVFLANRGGLGFMVDLHVAVVKQDPSVPRWKVVLYANVLRFVAMLGWPVFVWRG